MDDLLVKARSVLLDALEALDKQRDAVVVVGAQAIYLRSGQAIVAVAEATKDADLAINPRVLPQEPLLEEAMEAAGFYEVVGEKSLHSGVYRIRHDRIDSNGKLTLRHDSRLHHIGMRRRHASTNVLILVHDLHIRVLTNDGQLLRELQLDPTKNYQPQTKP
jgi:hypothetical protein